MIIYPKTNEYLGGLEPLKEYVDKGIEIQFLSKEFLDDVIEKTIREVKSKIPQLEEIIIHPPIASEFNFEALAFANSDVEKNRLINLVKISNELNLKIKMLYHTYWTCWGWERSGAMAKMKELISIIEGTNVGILIENIYPLVEYYEAKECSVLEIANQINSEHLKVCLDICHLHCLANIFKMNFEEFLEKYLNKEKVQKYIYQIHFAVTLNNDGVIDQPKTHGRLHDTWENFEKDYEILTRFGIEDRIIVPEISEENYETRADQIEEIKMLLKIHQ